MPNDRTPTEDQTDSDGLVRRSFGVSVKSIDKEKRCVEVIASTDSIDSYDEIVDQSWDLSRYQKNPVVLFNHNRGTMFAAHPSASLPIGYSSEHGVKQGRLEATLCFVDEKANPMAEMCWQGFVQGSLRAVSVGFNPRNVKLEMRDGQEIYRMSDNELYEISVCPMGANPDAVAKSKDSASAQLRVLAERTTDAASAAKKATTMAIDIEKQLAEATSKLEALAGTVKALETERDKLSTDVGAKSTEVVELTGKVKTLETERDALVVSEKAAKEAAAKSADELLVKTVDDLVGTKILPAEKDEFVELARTNKALFDKMVSKRADLALLGEPIVKADKSAPATTSSAAGSGENGGGLAELILAEDEKSKS